MVIDFHVHAFNPKVAEKAVEKLQACSGITPFTRGTAEETIQRFDEWGVDKGVLLSVATKPTQQRVINDWCAEQDGGRFISFGGIHPDAEDYEQEIAHIKELGLHGIKLHPDYQGFMIDDERMDKIYDAIERADLPVISPNSTSASALSRNASADRKSTRLNSSHNVASRMPSSA